MKLRKLSLVLLAGAAAATLAVAPAHAVVLKTSGDLNVGAYPSGDVAKAKINVEKATSGADNNKLRFTATVWCDNSAGAAVNCELIDGHNADTNLWKDPSGAPGQTVVQNRADYLDAADTHSKPFTHNYACEGTTLGIYKSEFIGINAVSRFFEPMTPKTRDSGWSALSGSCA